MSLALAIDCGAVVYAYCTCKVCQGGLDNHCMALMLEVASYSLKGLQLVPEEVSPTTLRCKWIGSSINDRVLKEPVMDMYISKCKVDEISKRQSGVKCTLYEARKCSKLVDPHKLSTFVSFLRTDNELIGLADLLKVDDEKHPYTRTQYGPSPVGSVLSYQLSLIEADFKVYLSTDSKNVRFNTDTVCYPKFPLSDVQCYSNHLDHVTPDENKGILQHLELSMEESVTIEDQTQGQQLCKDWFKLRVNRLTASDFGRVFDRKRNFENLAMDIYTSKTGKKKVSAFLKSKFDHGIKHEHIAARKYKVYMDRFGLPVVVANCGFVVNCNNYWLGASPDRKVYDFSEPTKFGIVEIKCPETRKDEDLYIAALDNKFYLEIINDKPHLKKSHIYYKQILGQMALTDAKWCDFVCYTYKSLVIECIYYCEDDWKSLCVKLDEFYFRYYLPLVTRES